MKNKNKKIILTVLTFTLVLFGSGCSFNLPAGIGNGGGSRGLYKTNNGGKTFEPKMTVNAEKNLSGVDILSIEIDPKHPEIIFLGTVGTGIFKSENAGDKWERILVGSRIYRVLVDPREDNTVYATGVYGKRGKIIKSIDGGKSWQDIYAEPQGDYLIISLEFDPFNPDVIYAGSSRGVLYKSEDKGVSWENIGELKGPITAIQFDAGDTRNIYLQVYEKGIYKIDYSKQVLSENEKSAIKSENNLLGGVEIIKISDRKINKERVELKKPLSLKADPRKPGVVYAAGNNGIYRTEDGGNSWDVIHSLEGPGDIPIRAFAIGDHNSDFLYFGAAGVLYRSVNYGKSWEALEFKTRAAIQVLEMLPGNDETFYLGLREVKQ